MHSASLHTIKGDEAYMLLFEQLKIAHSEHAPVTIGAWKHLHIEIYYSMTRSYENISSK